jgi:glycosyltransferase involved in cell wall biosynthesis
MAATRHKWDVDFTLSLHNRTGKYFIGKEIIDGLPDLIGNVCAWRVPDGLTSNHSLRRIFGRLWKEEERIRSRFIPALPYQYSSSPVLHLDPLSVLNWDISAKDLVLCHDLGPITHPELFDDAVATAYRRAYARIQKFRPRLVFVSLASRNAFETLYGADLPSQVIYPPIRSAVVSGLAAPVEGVGSRFLLTVGSIGRRKNQIASIRAFARSNLADGGMQYVICGTREPGADDVLAEAERTRGVVMLPYVSDDELHWLYGNASGFVLPSLLEGFGVPLAEAMCHGLVPLVSAESVLQEVAGPMAIAVEPTSDASIAAGMVELASLTKTEIARRQEGMKLQLSQYSSQAFLSRWRELLETPAADAYTSTTRIDFRAEPEFNTGLRAHG